MKKLTSKQVIQYLSRVAIFGAIASILYIVVKFNLPPFPPFLEFHFEEVVVLIAGFAYGPWTAIGILLVKTVVKLPFTTTLVVGEIVDLIYSLAFVLLAILFYRRNKTFKNAFIGLLIGALTQVVVSFFLTSFVMIDFYMAVYGLQEGQIVGMCQAVNPLITDVRWTLALFGTLPFNIVKDILIVAITLAVYKPTSIYLKRYDSAKNQAKEKGSEEPSSIS